jgi:hypothetical protein
MSEYKAAFAAGSQVRVAPRSTLEDFMRTWHFHNKLRPEQLEYANHVRRVASVGYYHGGDPLYVLEGLPEFVWHEKCLAPAEGMSQ